MAQALRCVPVVSRWVEQAVQMCDGTLALLFKDGACCQYPGTTPAYFRLALSWGRPGKFVWRFLGRMPHRIQAYRIIPLPCPAAGCATTTAVQSSKDPSNVGDLVTFTATVTNPAGGMAPQGSVEFFDGGTDLGPGSALSGSGGSATSTFSTSALAAGSHTITAQFTGTGGWLNSQGSVTQTVNSGGESACGCSGIPDTLHVTVSSQTGNCGLTNFALTYNAGGHFWSGQDAVNTTWILSCPNASACTGFILRANMPNSPSACSCSPFSLTFTNVALSGGNGCSGTATFTVTP